MAKYTAPQVAGRALIVDRGRLLLVRGDGDGTFWTLPGGRADLGEDIKSCVRREVYEETGLTVSVGDMYAVSEYYDAAETFHTLQVHFICAIESGAVQDGWVDQGGAVEEVRFFTHEELQAVDIVFPNFLRDGAWRDGLGAVRYMGMNLKGIDK